jgi:predicted nucleic acid-binding protein
VTAQEVLAHFDRWVNIHAIAPKAPYVCKDEDDQKFIDVAGAHQALLLSKDKQVLRLTNRLARLGVEVRHNF